MVLQISGMDLYYLTKEFNALVGGKVDKIYQIDKKELLFRLHVPNIGKKTLRIKLPNFIFLTQKRLKTPDNPPGFCMFLRKRLTNSRINEIKQIGMERILRFLFKTRDEEYYVFCELFSKGNMIVTDKDLKIIQPLERQIWKDRSLKKNEQYELPKPKKNIFEMSDEEIRDVIRTSNKDSIVTTLAVDLGLGGKYSEFVLDMLGIDKKSRQADIDEVIKGLRSLEDTSIIKKLYGTDSISEYLDKEAEAKLQEEKEEPKKKKKQESILKNQRMHIEKLEKDVKKYNEMGDLIYSNYADLKKILDEFNKARKDMPIKEIKKKIKNKRIMSIDEKEKTITFELN